MLWFWSRHALLRPGISLSTSHPPGWYQSFVSHSLQILVPVWPVGINEVQDPIDMEPDDGLFAVVGLKEPEALLAVLEAIFT